MALFVHCSGKSPSFHSNYSEISRRSRFSNGNTDVRGLFRGITTRIPQQLYEIKNILEFEGFLHHLIRENVSKNFSNGSFGKILFTGFDQTWSYSSQKLKGEKIHEDTERISDCNIVMMEEKCSHQEKECTGLFMVLSVTNIFMYTLPSMALTETCEANDSFFNMPFLFAIAMVGATVGGLLARQRKEELKSVNDQLRQINASLRRQAKRESYAPNLSYAPAGIMPNEEIIVDPRKEELISKLKYGKNFLRNQEPQKAFGAFQEALELARKIGDATEEKKAARGLGASLQRQGRYKDAIKYHSMVLSVSKRIGEESGNTEAFGAIADCYTEIGDLEWAGKFYDKYIARLETD